MVTSSCHCDIAMSHTVWNPESTSMPLAGLRVVDMADEKGETCGRFLADLGADVIRVEPPGGVRASTLRNANKRGVTADRSRLLALLDTADIWIESGMPGPPPAVALGRNPALVVLSITDFGRTGAYRD